MGSDLAQLLSETIFIWLLIFFPLPRSYKGFSSLKMLPDSRQINYATLWLISLNGTQEIVRSEAEICASFIYGVFVCLFSAENILQLENEEFAVQQHSV
uniref:Uncharacterized protein n=1 Tax=Coturnix japonica TaxID=93934 RepID=A0A8C2T6Q7_COTJA